MRRWRIARSACRRRCSRRCSSCRARLAGRRTSSSSARRTRSSDPPPNTSAPSPGRSCRWTSASGPGGARLFRDARDVKDEHAALVVGDEDFVFYLSWYAEAVVAQVVMPHRAARERPEREAPHRAVRVDRHPHQLIAAEEIPVTQPGKPPALLADVAHAAGAGRLLAK